MSRVWEAIGENKSSTCSTSVNTNNRYDNVNAERTITHVVAGGSTPNVMQLPSPVYFALFIDDTHVIVGAGGGGHRFGMANVLALIEVSTLASPVEHDVLNNELTGKTKVSNTAVNSSSSTEESVHSLWTYCCTLDLESDVPWCTSSFIRLENTPNHISTTETQSTLSSLLSSSEPHVVAKETIAPSGKAETEKKLNKNYADEITDKQRENQERSFDCTGTKTTEGTLTNSTRKDLIGYFAVSSISCFLLIGVYKNKLQRTTSVSAGDNKPRFAMSVLTRVALPNDPHNPDKKPISITQDAFVTVAHDENGVYTYNFRSLIEKQEKTTLEDLNEELTGNSKSKQKNGDTVIVAINYVKNNSKDDKENVIDDESMCTQKYVPFANWMVWTRLNDLHTNRFYNVKTKLVQNLHALYESNKHNTHDTDRSNDAAKGETHISKRVMCKALVRHYCLIAALGQDKTIKLAALRLPVTESEWKEIELVSLESSELQTRHVIELQTIATLGSVDYNLPFTPLTSSLRIVRLFGLENLGREKCEAINTQCDNSNTNNSDIIERNKEKMTEVDAKRALTLATLQYGHHIQEQQRQKQTKEEKEMESQKEQQESVDSKNDNPVKNVKQFDSDAIVSSIVVVAFDARENKSYMLTGQVQMSLEDVNYKTNVEVQNAEKSCNSVSNNNCTNSSSDKLQQALPSLSVQMSSCSSFILNDCITCIAPVVNDTFMKYRHDAKDSSKRNYEHDIDSSNSSSSSNNNELNKTSQQLSNSNFSELSERRGLLAQCTGTSLPRCWLAGTVDGTVALIELHTETDYGTLTHTQHFSLRATRPVGGAHAKRMASEFPALHSEPISGIAISTLNDVVTTDIAQHVVLTTLPLIEQTHQLEEEKCKQHQHQHQQRRSKEAVSLFPSCAFESNVNSNKSNNGIISNYFMKAGNVYTSPKTLILFVISLCVIVIAFILHESQNFKKKKTT